MCKSILSQLMDKGLDRAGIPAIKTIEKEFLVFRWLWPHY